MKALVIAPEPFYTPRGTPFSVYYRTLVTAELGVEVDLLTYGQGQDVEIEGVRILRIPRFAFLGDVKVGPSMLKIFLDIFLALRTVLLLLRNRYDFVHAHEEAVFLCRILKPLFRFKLVYDMHSSLPQQLTNFRFTKSRLLIGMFDRLEASSLAASEAVITICPDLARYALESVEPDRHFLIENSIFDEVRLVEAGGRAGQGAPTGPGAAAGRGPEEDPFAAVPTDRPLVVYAGTLEAYQGIDLLLRAFQQVRSQLPEVFLLVVGGSPAQVEEYSSLARDLGLEPHCLFTGRVTQRLAKRACGMAAVQVSPRSHGSNTPLKVYEQLASGIPLVATRIHSHTQVLDDRVAFLVKPDPDEMAQGIVTALSDQGARQERTTAARQLYEEQYSRTAYVEKMRRLLARLG